MIIMLQSPLEKESETIDKDDKTLNNLVLLELISKALENQIEISNYQITEIKQQLKYLDDKQFIESYVKQIKNIKARLKMCQELEKKPEKLLKSLPKEND